MSLKDDIGEAEKAERERKTLVYRELVRQEVMDALRHKRRWEKVLEKRLAELERVETMIRERKYEPSLDGPKGGERDA